MQGCVATWGGGLCTPRLSCGHGPGKQYTCSHVWYQLDPQKPELHENATFNACFHLARRFRQALYNDLVTFREQALEQTVQLFGGTYAT